MLRSCPTSEVKGVAETLNMRPQNSVQLVALLERGEAGFIALGRIHLKHVRALLAPFGPSSAASDGMSSGRNFAARDV